MTATAGAEEYCGVASSREAEGKALMLELEYVTLRIMSLAQKAAGIRTRLKALEEYGMSGSE